MLIEYKITEHHSDNRPHFEVRIDGHLTGYMWAESVKDIYPTAICVKEFTKIAAYSDR